MKVEILESGISDNYFYLIADEGGVAAVIDPIDPAATFEALEDRGWDLRYVINTHFHPDHVGGDDAIFEAYPDALLVAGRVDANAILNQIKRESVDEAVGAGDVVRVGNLHLDVYDTPGHTPGHISLAADGWLFSGDTVFVGGAGNCRFGGNPGVLFETFRDVLPSIDDEVRFAPGHDYSVRNIEFALSIEPEHSVAQKMLERARAADGLFVTSLGEERSYNPFMRFGEPELQDALRSQWPDKWAAEQELSSSDEETAFRLTRSLRNDW